METKQIVFLVKFDLGYYANKQPNYEWSYTEDPFLANQYKTEKAAHERGNHGIRLSRYGDIVVPESYMIERYSIETVMKFVDVVPK